MISAADASVEHLEQRLRWAKLQTPVTTEWGTVEYCAIALCNLSMTAIPPNVPHLVANWFDVSGNCITSLNGSPHRLVYYGDYNARNSSMSSDNLVPYPHFDCTNTDITNLDGISAGVRTLCAKYTKLTSLSGIPSTVNAIYLTHCHSLSSLDGVNGEMLEVLDVVFTRMDCHTDFYKRFPNIRRTSVHVHGRTCDIFEMLTQNPDNHISLAYYSSTSPHGLDSETCTLSLTTEDMLSEQQVSVLRALEARRNDHSIFCRRGRLAAYRALCDCGLERLTKA